MAGRVLLHVGMHKTGSTSIQHTLSRLDMQAHHYAQLGPSNHSTPLAAAFGPAESVRFLIDQGLSAQQIAARGTAWRDKLDHEIEAAQGRTLILSAEGLSGHARPPVIVEALAKFLHARQREVQVLAYVRRPVSALVSVFQQKIKGGRAMDNALMPVRYRDRLEPFDLIFGRDAVTLVPFDLATFPGKDVVADFCNRAGIALPDGAVRRINESLSLEATAALAANNTHGHDFGQYRTARRDRTLMIDDLRRLGTRQLRLSPQIVAQALDETAEQIDWLEARIGQPMRDALPDAPSDAGDVVAGEADLWELAAAQAGPLEKQLLALLRAEADPVRRVAQTLDLIRILSVARHEWRVRDKDEGTTQ